jgi:hypothetical protein
MSSGENLRGGDTLGNKFLRYEVLKAVKMSVVVCWVDGFVATYKTTRSYHPEDHD